MPNIFKSIWSYLDSLGMAFAGQLKSAIAGLLKAFPTDDLGKLAVDAVAYAETEFPGASSADKKAAALAKFKTDATNLGHDIETWAESLYNWFIETALQVYLNNQL